MLALSRQRDESIIICLPDGTEVEVCVVDIRGDKVRLGFNARKDIKIYRKEVLDAIRGGNRNAKVE